MSTTLGRYLFCLLSEFLPCRPLHEVFHLWTLAGGDLEGELKKRGLIKTKPPIMSLPMYVLQCQSQTFLVLAEKPDVEVSVSLSLFAYCSSPVLFVLRCIACIASVAFCAFSLFDRVDTRKSLKCWFLRRGETRVPEETPLGARTRTNNGLIEPGPHWWEASAVTTAPSLLPSFFTHAFYKQKCHATTGQPYYRDYTQTWI